MKTILFIFSLLILNTSFSLASEAQIVEIQVTKAGFVPNVIKVTEGKPVVFKITRKTDSTCAREIQIPTILKDKTELPLDKTVELKLGLLKAGEFKFGCGMDMMINGKIKVEKK